MSENKFQNEMEHQRNSINSMKLFSIQELIIARQVIDERTEYITAINGHETAFADVLSNNYKKKVQITVALREMFTSRGLEIK